MARHWAPLRDPDQPPTRSRSINRRGSVGNQWGQRPMFSEPGEDQLPPEQGTMPPETQPDDVHPTDERVGSNATTDLTKADPIQPVSFHMINYNVSSPPTDAEIRAAIGSATMEADTFLIRDGTGAGVVYLVVRSGGDTWWYQKLTKAL